MVAGVGVAVMGAWAGAAVVDAAVMWCSDDSRWGDSRWGGHIKGGGGAVSLFVKWGVMVGKMWCGGLCVVILVRS